MGGIYISHKRDEANGVLDSVRETIDIGEKGGLPTQITHHKVIGRKDCGRAVDTLRLVDEARARGIDGQVRLGQRFEVTKIGNEERERRSSCTSAGASCPSRSLTGPRPRGRQARLREAFPWDKAPRGLVHDRDTAFHACRITLAVPVQCRG